MRSILHLTLILYLGCEYTFTANDNDTTSLREGEASQERKKGDQGEEEDCKTDNEKEEAYEEECVDYINDFCLEELEATIENEGDIPEHTIEEIEAFIEECVTGLIDECGQ